jgi:MarR family transcriptional regulator, lower aerobic nicotinate degradation pathway regulator
MTPTAPTPPIACVPRELVTSHVFLLGRLGAELKKRALDELEAAGFGIHDYKVLALLGEGECTAQSTMAELISVDRSQLVGLLDDLEERGLVERHRAKDDRRRHTVTLTGAGREQLTLLRTIVKRVEEEFLAPLDDESRRQLYELLARLARYHDARFASPAVA